MTQYILTYINNNELSAEQKPSQDSKKHFARYQAWLASLGDAVISPANPFKDTHTVNSDGSVTSGSITSMSGYTIIDVESMEAALEFAKACPFLVMGSLEVSELMQMPS